MSKPARGRPPVEYRRILDGLLDRIACGRYPPASRFPTYSELMQEFGGTRATVCQVVTTLVGTGHLVTRGRNGTFVSAAPPCRSRLALLLPRAENEDAGFSCFWQSLADAAATLEGTGGYTVEVFTGPRLQAGSPSYLRLLAELEQRLIGGLILVATPAMYARTPVQAAAVPQIYLGSEAHPGQLCVLAEQHTFRRAMIATMVATGCRRPVVVGGSQRFGNRAECDRWLELAREAGLVLRDEHLLGIDIAHPVMAERLIRLLCAAGPGLRPDGLLVADDNLLDACQQGLAAAGVRIGRDIQVAAHLNRPTRLQIDPQVRPVAFDTGSMLHAAIGLIRVRQAGKGPTEAAIAIEAEPG
jgi:GntR family transcriptional regulator